MSYYTERVSVSGGNINDRGSANNVVGGNNKRASGDFLLRFHRNGGCWIVVNFSDIHGIPYWSWFLRSALGTHELG